MPNFTGLSFKLYVETIDIQLLHYMFKILFASSSQFTIRFQSKISVLQINNNYNCKINDLARKLSLVNTLRYSDDHYHSSKKSIPSSMHVHSISSLQLISAR